MKILIISKLFPPDKAARALQISKVVTALNKNNCEPFVIAGYAKNTAGKNIYQNNNFLHPIKYVSYAENKTNKTFIKRALNRIKCEMMSINSHSKWVRKTYYQSLKVIKQFQPELILTSSSPFESHLVGLLLKEETQIPWISSFSDPWPSYIEPYPYDVYNIPVVNKLQMALLKKVLTNADAIHTTNKNASELIPNKFLFSLLHKFFAIPHVASKTDFFTSNVKDGCIAHIGALTRERLSKPLFKAFKHLAANSPDIFHKLELVGTICSEFIEFENELDVNFFIEKIGYKSSSDALKIASAAEILLVIEANMTYSPYLPSKFADYACTGRPILAITPKNSPMRYYLNKYGGGVAVSHNQAEIISAVKKIVQNSRLTPKSGDQRENQLLCENFEADSIARQYRSMFNEVI